MKLPSSLPAWSLVAHLHFPQLCLSDTRVPHPRSLLVLTSQHLLLQKPFSWFSMGHPFRAALEFLPLCLSRSARLLALKRALADSCAGRLLECFFGSFEKRERGWLIFEDRDKRSLRVGVLFTLAFTQFDAQKIYPS